MRPAAGTSRVPLRSRTGPSTPNMIPIREQESHAAPQIRGELAQSGRKAASATLLLMNILRRIAGTLLAPALVTAGMAAPAHAYGTLTFKYARVDTDNCARLSGTLPVSNQGNGCFLDDPFDDNFFLKDAGGIAIKVELYSGGLMVAKIEFHPLDEQLWVYDTRNDGDTVYAMGHTGDRTSRVIGSAGGDPVLEWDVYDDDGQEGDLYSVNLYDGKNGPLPVEQIYHIEGRC